MGIKDVSDDSTRRRFVIDAVTVHAADPFERLGGDSDGGVGTSGKTGGIGGENTSAAPTASSGDATAGERTGSSHGVRVAERVDATDRTGGR
ncbi:hypothetical protein C474_09472 [Halogeometricum pallidum JCM 14848]|uniref:Uncharacterized protein n=1 Tax=Halogeometricum pallidum JCM 14848 TaxID=1227487 RepID=M0D7R1_HALPD|nr:hypothetical protein C474_09472 [Halogeometricum pallidum JCM 14848]